MRLILARRLESMNGGAYDPRTGIRELLCLLSSDEQQLAYERDVPYVDITAELLCMWFDDSYHPNESWSRYFNKEELAALAEFHRIYDEASRDLPESHGTVRTWLAEPAWQRMMAAAEITLAKVSEQKTQA